MKHLQDYIIERGPAPIRTDSNIPEFGPESEIKCDGMKEKYKIGKLQIIDHATTFDEAIEMIESSSDEDFFYFVKWNKSLHSWECATQTFYFTKKGASKDNILISSEGNGKTKETLEKNMKQPEYVLAKVSKINK